MSSPSRQSQMDPPAAGTRAARADRG
jgi:hypothetical protein